MQCLNPDASIQKGLQFFAETGYLHNIKGKLELEFILLTKAYMQGIVRFKKRYIESRLAYMM